MLVDGPIAFPNPDVLVSDWVCGDDRQFQRTVTAALLEAGDAPTKAYLTIKKSQADPDSSAIAQIVIDTTNQVQGRITGAGPWTLKFNVFGLSVSQISGVNPNQIYYYDIRVISTPSNAVWTPENGQIQFVGNTTANEGPAAPTQVPFGGQARFLGWAAGPPTITGALGPFWIGDWYRNVNPASGEPSGWTCIIAGAVGTWRTDGIVGDTDGS